MLLCKECRKTIANVGNPTAHYSTCIDCGKKYEEEQRLLGQVPDDEESEPYVNPGEAIMEKMARKGKVDIIYPKGYDEESELESLINNNPDDGSWKGR